jgi:hypothetical protein
MHEANVPVSKVFEQPSEHAPAGNSFVTNQPGRNAALAAPRNLRIPNQRCGESHLQIVVTLTITRTRPGVRGSPRRARAMRLTEALATLRLRLCLRSIQFMAEFGRVCGSHVDLFRALLASAAFLTGECMRKSSREARLNCRKVRTDGRREV